MGIAGGAAITAAAAIGSAAMSSSAIGSASSAQQSEDNAAIAQQQGQLAQEQANEAPYLETGSGALAQLSSLYGINTPTTSASGASAAGYSANQSTPTGTYTNAAGGSSTTNPDASFYLSPDYNFTLTQGLQGLTAAGAATNGTQNGAQQEAEISYAGNLASGQYDQYVSNLQGLAGLGASASSSVNQATAGTSNAISSTEQTAGSNEASSDLAQGTTDASLLSNLSSTAQKYLTSSTPSASMGGLGTATGAAGYTPATGGF